MSPGGYRIKPPLSTREFFPLLSRFPLSFSICDLSPCPSPRAQLAHCHSLTSSQWTDESLDEWQIKQDLTTFLFPFLKVKPWLSLTYSFFLIRILHWPPTEVQRNLKGPVLPRRKFLKLCQFAVRGGQCMLRASWTAPGDRRSCTGPGHRQRAVMVEWRMGRNAVWIQFILAILHA